MPSPILRCVLQETVAGYHLDTHKKPFIATSGIELTVLFRLDRMSHSRAKSNLLQKVFLCHQYSCQTNEHKIPGHTCQVKPLPMHHLNETKLFTALLSIIHKKLLVFQGTCYTNVIFNVAKLAFLSQQAGNIIFISIYRFMNI